MTTSKIICKRYDVEGIINRDLISHMRFDEGYLQFYEWLDKPGYYLIFEDGEYGMYYYETLNRVGEYDESHFKEGDEPYGYARANIALPVTIGVFHWRFRWKFLEYIIENYVTEHFWDEQKSLHKYGWYKIEKLEPEKWLNEFIEIKIRQQIEREKEEMKGQQIDLF